MTRPKKRAKKQDAKKQTAKKETATNKRDLDFPDFQLPAFDFPPLDLPDIDFSGLLGNEQRPAQERPVIETPGMLRPAVREPEEKIGPQGSRKGPAKDVAMWMLKELGKTEELYQKHAAAEIRQNFGGGFLYLNHNGNPAIVQEVLREFRELTEETVVWVKRKRFWRWREQGDPLGKREVE